MSITLNVTVENKGTALAGDEVVQLYLKPLNLSSIWLPRHPRKTLASMLREARVRTISFSLVAHTQ